MRVPRGFTLIELMIVVAIVGLLAAVAIPNFLNMQLRTRRAEIPTNVDGIRTAEQAYHAEWDSYTTAWFTPADLPGRQRAVFDSTYIDMWRLLGWAPDGTVYAMYEVDTVGGGDADGDSFFANAYGDIDGDGNLTWYAADHERNVYMVSDNDFF